MTEQGLATTTESKRRGVGFPSLALQDAVDAVVTAGQNGPDHTQDAFATYLGHKTANSGAFRAKLASLRDWGLIARGDRDRVILSGLAQELVLAAPDHYEDKQKLLTAFESCRVFGMVYNDSAKNVPVDTARLRTQVLMRYGVASDQADKFVEVFVKSAVFTGIAESDGARVTLFNRDSVFTGAKSADDTDDDLDTDTPHLGTPMVSRSGFGGSGQLTATGVANVPVAVAEPTIPVALRQSWRIDGGEIEFVIRTSEALPPSIYALVAEMAEVAEKMKEKLTGPAFEITAGATVPAAHQTRPVPELTDGN